jgi:hypothetical protein
MASAIFQLLLVLVLFAPLAPQPKPATRSVTVESIGKQILEAIKTKDFAPMEAMMPTEEVVAELMKAEVDAAGKSATATPAQLRAKMKEKMQQELEDILKSAKSHRVKLSKLQHGGILQDLINPESSLPMHAVVMEIRYLERPVDIAYTAIQHGGQWYYLGILISHDVFSQLEG